MIEVISTYWCRTRKTWKLGPVRRYHNRLAMEMDAVIHKSKVYQLNNQTGELTLVYEKGNND